MFRTHLRSPITVLGIGLITLSSAFSSLPAQAEPGDNSPDLAVIDIATTEETPETPSPEDPPAPPAPEATAPITPLPTPDEASSPSIPPVAPPAMPATDTQPTPPSTSPLDGDTINGGLADPPPSGATNDPHFPVPLPLSKIEGRVARATLPHPVDLEVIAFGLEATPEKNYGRGYVDPLTGNFSIKVPEGSYILQFKGKEDNEVIPPQYFTNSGKTTFSRYLATPIEVKADSTQLLSDITIFQHKYSLRINFQEPLDLTIFTPTISVTEIIDEVNGNAATTYVSPAQIDKFGFTLPVIDQQSTFIIEAVAFGNRPGPENYRAKIGPFSYGQPVLMRWVESGLWDTVPVTLIVDNPYGADLSSCYLNPQFQDLTSRIDSGRLIFSWTKTSYAPSEKIDVNCYINGDTTHRARVIVSTNTAPLTIKTTLKPYPDPRSRDVLVHTNGLYASYDPYFTPTLIPSPDNPSASPLHYSPVPELITSDTSSEMRQWRYTNVPPGRYILFIRYHSGLSRLSLAHEGDDTYHYFGGGFPDTAQVINIPEGTGPYDTKVVFPLPEPATIQGNISKITVATDSPFSATRIVLFRKEDGQWKRLKQTEGLGAFRFRNVMPGTYTLGFLNPLAPHSEETDEWTAPPGILPRPEKYPYCTQFYDGSASLSQAKSFEVKAGEFLTLDPTILSPTCIPQINPNGQVSISFDPNGGHVFTLKHNPWLPEGVLLSYQWYVDGRPLFWATRETLKLPNSDRGKLVTVEVKGILNNSSVLIQHSRPVYFGKQRNYELKTNEDVMLFSQLKLLRTVETILEGIGYLPNEIVRIFLHSDPIHLTDVQADEQGRFVTTVTLPADVPLGAHHIRATGVDSKKVTEVAVTISDTANEPPVTLSPGTNPPPPTSIPARPSNEQVAPSQPHAGGQVPPSSQPNPSGQHSTLMPILTPPPISPDAPRGDSFQPQDNASPLSSEDATAAASPRASAAKAKENLPKTDKPVRQASGLAQTGAEVPLLPLSMLTTLSLVAILATRRSKATK